MGRSQTSTTSSDSRRLTVVRQVRRSQTTKALEYQNGSLELQPLPDWKPVELTEDWRDVVKLPGSSEKGDQAI